MSAAKPPVTYARRHRARSAAAQNTTVSLPSSPLEELSPSKQDVPISEMTRRMKKRSRQVSSGGDESLRDASYRSAKKLKRRSQGDLRASEHVSLAPTVPSTPVIPQDAPTFPLDSQQIYDSLFETPACTTTEDTIMRSYLQPIAPEDLSPVPVSRRMLSRTSSRNFKENRKSLASPFNSRPGSRAASPRRYSKTPIKPLQNRSRTFSSSNYSQHRKSASVSRYTNSQTEETKDSIFDSIYSSAQAPASHSTQSHTRTGSIPNVSSNLLDHISMEDWLVPPKAMSRSPPSLEDMDLDDFSAEHPSFYFDAPVQASSPPRRRRTTVTLRDFRPMVPNRSQSDSMLLDSTQLSASQDITVTEAGSENPTSNVRGRRRTVVHMSGDSIFSSALDFSAYMTEGSPTKVHKILVPPVNLSSRGLSATQSAPVPPAPPGLDPAFSPAPVFFPPPPGTPESNSANVSSISAACATRQVPPTPYVPRPSLSRRTRSLLESSESDKLHEMFTSLGLDETKSRLSGQDDSGVGLDKFLPEPSFSSRARSNTIRASDYAQPSLRPSLSLDAGSSASAAPWLTTKKPTPPPTTRTRSGTITLANARTQPAAIPPRPARNMRRKGGLPTIKMKIDKDPLPPQGSDEEEDELLLRADVFWKDPE